MSTLVVPLLLIPVVAGAVLAELRFMSPPGPTRDPVSAWLLRVPLYLAAITSGVTGLVLVLARGDGQWGQVLEWGAAALAADTAVTGIGLGPDNQIHWATRVTG